MKRRLAILIATLLIINLLILGCSVPKNSFNSASNDFITIATGGSTGVYYALGGAIAKLLNDNLQGVKTSVQSTGGSAVNCTLLGSKKAELAFTMNDVASYAFTGTEVFKNKGKIENLRGIASLYPNYVQVVTLNNNINSIDDLKGKKIGVGAPGSGTEINARQILSAYGITYEDIEEDYLSFSEAVEQLRNGSIDAAFLASGLPNSTIMDLVTTHQVKLLPVSREIVEKLKINYPFYTPTVIPAGTYKNKTDIETAAVTTLLITREDMSEEFVYNITKTIFENLDVLRETHSAAQEIDLKNAVEGMTIPLHPGAEKYYKESKKD